MSELCIKNLCYIVNDKGEVLLQFKRRGFGVGKWNGPGGKVELGETSEQAVIREVKEETGLNIVNPKKMAELEFNFKDREEWNQTVYVYLIENYDGEIMESEEGELKWFKFDEIPYDKMWEDDLFWLPNILAGEFKKMKFYFDHEGHLQKYEKI